MRIRNALNIAACAVTVLSLAPAAADQKEPSASVTATRPTGAPTAQQPTETRAPLVIYRANLASRPLRALVVPGIPVTESVKTFIERASISTPGEREQIRALIARSSTNEQVATALASSVFDSRTRDYTQTLTALSILGELRHPLGQAALTKFVALPLPETGHNVEGEISERATLEKLQMKAVDGLAYARTATADQEVLRIAGMNPSRAVRSEAIAAYLFNHQNSDEARKQLLQAVKPDERIFVDRPSYVPGMTGAAFNEQLARYLKLHPERLPSKPDLARASAIMIARDKEKDARTAAPRPLVNPPALQQP